VASGKILTPRLQLQRSPRLKPQQMHGEVFAVSTRWRTTTRLGAASLWLNR